jgi:hypothetical protein
LNILILTNIQPAHHLQHPARFGIDLRSRKFWEGLVGSAPSNG